MPWTSGKDIFFCPQCGTRLGDITVEETVRLDDIILNLIDTAGIRDTEDLIEKIGVDKALDSIDDADLILFVIDSSRPLDENDEFIINKIIDKKVIILLNKSDLVSQISSDDTLYITNSRQAACLSNARTSLLNVLNSIDNLMPEDFFSIDLMDAYNFLGEITGETIDDDLANKIFSEFCMGK